MIRVFSLKKLALCTLLFSSLAFAEERRTLGVFLPVSVADAQERFALAEGLADTLSAALNVKVAGKNFGKYEDFAKAVASGQLDFALTDGFIAAQLPPKGSVVALAQKPGPAASGRWVLVSKAAGPVKALAGKRIAIPKGAAGQDLKFLSNVIFAGDYDAQKNLKSVSVPNVESALQSLDVKAAEAALVPAELLRKGEKPLFRSSRIIGVVVLSLKGDAVAAQATFTSAKAPAPFEKFVAPTGKELGELRELLKKGPPRREPVVAVSPVLRLDMKPVIRLEKVGPFLPSFAESVGVADEQPDD